MVGSIEVYEHHHSASQRYRHFSNRSRTRRPFGRPRVAANDLAGSARRKPVPTVVPVTAVIASHFRPDLRPQFRRYVAAGVPELDIAGYLKA